METLTLRERTRELTLKLFAERIDPAASHRLRFHRSVSHELYQRVNDFCSSEQSNLSRVVINRRDFHYINIVSKSVFLVKSNLELKTYQHQHQ